MRIPLDWLEEFVDLPADPADLARRLTMAGLEVERVAQERVAPGVVVARVVEVRPHPQAERIQVCRVDLGDHVIEVVCGAPGVAAGDLVPAALPGAVLPSGAVEAREVRGVRSLGMLCSERDLGLGDDHEGLLSLQGRDLGPPGRIAAGPEPGIALDAVLPAVTVLEVAITPNRGDCCSILGMAREVSALYGTKLRLPRRQSAPAQEDEDGPFAVAVEAHDLCPWYCAQRVQAPTAQRSPLWLKRRILACGVRPISPAVDVTNFVMLERGQPLHAFDLDRLEGNRLVTRRAVDGEALALLDGREIALLAGDLVIADARGPVALAGVMGGARSEVHHATRRIVLESAVFAPSSVRRTARRLAVHTEASFRFERGVDPSGPDAAIARAAGLLAGLGGRPVGRMLEAGGKPGDPAPIALVPKRVNALLGTAVEPQEMVRRLRAVGATVRRTHGETVEVVPPAYRADLRQAADLAEEIARVGGYDVIPTVRPRIAARGRPGAAGGLRRIQTSLAARGFAEAVLLAFGDATESRQFPGPWPEAHRAIEVRNPLASVARELRRSLLPGLLGALRANQDRGETFVALFAVGTVFATPDGEELLERTSVAGLVWGMTPPQIGRMAEAVSFLDVKRILGAVLEEAGRTAPRWVPRSDVPFLHPGRTAEIRLGAQALGCVGALHPAVATELDLRSGDVWLFELDGGMLAGDTRSTTRYVEPPRYPAVERDVAMIVAEDVTAASVVEAVLSRRHSLVERAAVFDEYRGQGVPAGRKSLAFRISYRAADRTLTDAEVNVVHEETLRLLAQTVSFERRGVGA